MFRAHSSRTSSRAGALRPGAVATIALALLLGSEPRRADGQGDDFAYLVEVDGISCRDRVQGPPGEFLDFNFTLRVNAPAVRAAGLSFALAGEGPDLSFHFRDVDVPPDEIPFSFGCDEAPGSAAGDLCCSRWFFGPRAQGDEVFFCGINIIDPDVEPSTGPLAQTGPQGPGIVGGIALRVAPSPVYVFSGEFSFLEARVRARVPLVGEETVRLFFKDGLLGSGRHPIKAGLAVDSDPWVPLTTGCEFTLVPSTSALRFRRGDADGDGQLDVTDVIRILSVLFLGAEPFPCRDAADSSDNGIIDIADAIRVLSFLFLGTTHIPGPGSRVCGVDPTFDPLECAAYPACPQLE